MTPITWYLYGRSGGAKKAAEEIGVKESVSGDVASFADGADNIPMQSLVAEITPVQSGSGDPSPTNIRPISGRTGLTGTRVGKNLIDDSIKTSQSAATVVIGQTSTAGFDIFLPAGTYTVSFASEKNPSINYRLSTESSGAHAVVSYGNRSGTFTLTESAYLRMWAYLSGGIVPSDITWFQLEAGSTATAYEPYTAQTYPITWQTEAGTVYGGTLDVVSGVLTVTHFGIRLTSTNQSWRSAGSVPAETMRYYCTLDPAANASTQNIMCSHARNVSGNASPWGTCFLYNGVFAMKNGDGGAGFSTLADFRTWLDENNLQVCYELATPQTYQLNPTEARTLLGGNTIYTDAGEVTVEYVADTKLYIDNKVAELQALILEH